MKVSRLGSLGHGSNAISIVSGSGGYNSPIWSPFPSSQNYIGTLGIFGNASSAFLVSEVGPQVTSVLSFAATTPTSATVTGSSGSGGADLAFTLTADSIIKFQYVNHLYSVPVSVIPVTGTTSAHQVLVVFDGSAGTIDLVVPVAGKARGKRLEPAARHGDNLTYTGQFLAIYDKDGRNLAKQGASSITINGKTGQLVQFK